MTFISAKEAAVKWGISQRRVSTLCAEKRIHNAEMVGNVWIIPADAEKPQDARSLRYVEQPQPGVKPFLKWAGGKGQLLSEISAYYPFDDSKFTKYAEPFVGGGAVLFDVLNKFDLEAVYISDVNRELIGAYKSIKENVDELIARLQEYQSAYLPELTEGRKAYYMKMRAHFNELKLVGRDADQVERAALLIFLNKTCFNGLYRVNKKGAYNVPMGAYKRPLICDEENLRGIAQKLQNVEIVCADYSMARDFIDEHTFVYFDPPYRPLTATASFTSYTADCFNDDDQIALAKFVDEMAAKGAKVVVSNSDPKNADEEDMFFDDIYAAHKIRRVSATRMINSKATARGKISELLISNF
ncbi:DNA adenine methylase [Selenomonas ruminantium]|uniref:Site-specific DNA-methyltransferase (adenine-specific) n=2 Tax=Selenomonas ruminantium TaxID=971 RepID=A0A1I0VC82_SELRU|nr:DNA adenine methylase [Selenomonas ruminantium]SFA73974.1 DNA adenine methylase [Selenomonas ruminantium]